MSRRIVLDIAPREQFRAFLNRKERFACVVAHRRAGKTFACVQDLIRHAIGYKREGPPCRFGYIAPTRDQAKDIAWQYLKDYSAAIPGVKFNEAELVITYPNRSIIRLYSGDSYERMRGLYFDGVVVDEPADIDPNAWPYVIMPCLSDYSGWATFIGTCKGKNAFYRQFHHGLTDPEWFTMALRTSESGIIPASELATLRANMTPDAYAQEYECDWTVGVPGAIYAKWIEEARQAGRVGAMPVDGSSPVHTAWDLGAPMQTVVWYFQTVGRFIRMLGCDRDYDETVVERVARMKAAGWRFGEHFLPHDALQKERSGKTMAAEVMAAGLANVRIVPRTANIWIGINHMRQMFPSLEFRTPECDGGLEALEAYHTREEKTGLLSKTEPVHDWASHAADAFRTMGEAHALGMFKFTAVQPHPDDFPGAGGAIRSIMGLSNARVPRARTA